jgi:hypothetical protein
MEIKKLKNFLIQSRKTTDILSISVWMKVKSFVCHNQLKKIEQFYMKLYDQSTEIINHNLDIVNYMKFNQEFIILKHLLLSEFQLKCFKFIRKPKTYEENEFLKIKSNDYNDLLNIFTVLKQKEEFSGIDKKVYELLSEDLKKILS